MAARVQRLQSGKVYRVYESTTGQTIGAFAGCIFHDHFLGTNLQSEWTAVTVAGGTKGFVADQSGGHYGLNLSTATEAQDSVLYFNDERPFDMGEGLIWEATIKVTSASMTGIRFVAGVCGNHYADKDTTTDAAWFSMDGDLVLDVETDDATNNLNAQTGTTWVTTESHVLRIDATSLADVKFYLDDSRVASGTTFDMSNLTATSQQMQPYFSLDKASGGSACTIAIDEVWVIHDTA